MRDRRYRKLVLSGQALVNLVGDHLGRGGEDWPADAKFAEGWLDLTAGTIVVTVGHESFDDIDPKHPLPITRVEVKNPKPKKKARKPRATKPPKEVADHDEGNDE